MKAKPKNPNTRVDREALHITRATIDSLIEQKKMRALAQSHNSNMFLALGLVISLLLTTLAFEWKTSGAGDIMDLGQVAPDLNEVLDVPITEQLPPPPPTKTQTFNFQEVEDNIVIENLEIELDVEVTEDMVIEDVPEFTGDVEEEKIDEIFTVVENPPVPSGGFEGFYAFLGQNLKYPPEAARLGIEGKVFIQFVVEKDGSLTQVKTVKGFYDACDKEAERVVRLSPKWTPGKQRGREVRTRFVLPVIFKLHQDN